MEYHTNAEPRAMIGDVPVFCAYDELLDIGKAVPNPKNPNSHPKAQIELLLNNVGTGSILPAKITSDITQYENYVPENAVDNDTKTHFWCRDPIEGSHITLDFGSVQHVASIRLLMGAEGFEKDFVKNGTLQYSADGTTWTDITNVSTATVAVGNLDIYCRYLRLRCNAAQLEWVTVMEFNAYA